MSETHFTWWVDEDGCDVLTIVGPREKCRRFGVENTWEMCRIDNAIFWDDPATKREDEANAHLISAAPALYEALADLIARIDDDPNYVPESEALLRARAALSQARGEK